MIIKNNSSREINWIQRNQTDWVLELSILRLRIDTRVHRSLINRICRKIYCDCILKINRSIIFSRKRGHELLILKRVFDAALLNGDQFHNGFVMGVLFIETTIMLPFHSNKARWIKSSARYRSRLIKRLLFAVCVVRTCVSCTLCMNERLDTVRKVGEFFWRKLIADKGRWVENSSRFCRNEIN